jgi:hypothetical protein
VFLLHGHFGDLRLANPNGPWYLAWGRYWAIVFALDRTFSLGIHVEPRRRERGAEPYHYGPYVDIHLPMLTISFGNNPVYVSSLEAQRAYSRGGLN